MTKVEVLKDIINEGLIKEIYKIEESIFLYNKISENALSINNNNFGSFFGSTQRHLLDTIFLSISKIYEYNIHNKVRSIPHLKKTLQNHCNQIAIQEYRILKRDLLQHFSYDLQSDDTNNNICLELSEFIKNNNPFKGTIAQAIKNSRDKLIAHSEINTSNEDLVGITWEEINILLIFAKNITSIISSAFLSICYIDDNNHCESTNYAERATVCLDRLLKEANIID